MRAKGKASVVGPASLGAEPAALEERGRDVAAVADHVDGRRLRVRLERRREDEARLRCLLDAAQTAREPEQPNTLEDAAKPPRDVVVGHLRSARGSPPSSGCTSSRSTNPGSDPSALPVNVVPERGEPTTNTRRSSEPSRRARRAIRTALRPYSAAFTAAFLAFRTEGI